MRKFIGVSVTVVVGVVGLVSLVSALIELPAFVAFFSGRISWLNASLGYREETLLAAGVLASAAWAFDLEIDREKGPRKRVVAAAFIGIVAAFGLLATSFDRLDVDSWSSVAVADGRAVSGPHEGTDPKGSRQDGVRSASDTGQTDGQEGSTANSGSGFESDALQSKGESGSSEGCTCPPVVIPEGPSQRGSGEEAEQPEEEWGWNEEAEAAEEAAEEAEEEREEAEWEAEIGP